MACFVSCTTALTGLPLTLMSTRMGATLLSQSHRSWCTVWKCQTRSPVAHLTHTMLLPNTLLPRRWPPYMSPVGDPVGRYAKPSSSSTLMADQTFADPL